MGDLKKTLQRELKSSDPGGGDPQPVVNNHYYANQYNSNALHYNSSNHQQTNGGDDEVNFLYLKHVIMKFLTSREYEVVCINLMNYYEIL